MQPKTITNHTIENVEQRLTTEETREILRRAEQIHFEGAFSEGATSQEMLNAAVEAGLSQEAIDTALQERLARQVKPKEGDQVFAKSNDGKFYVATVLRQEQNGYEIEFAKGGSSTIAPNDMLRFEIVPGAKLVCPWPDWGWWTCSVLEYNKERQRVKVTDGWGQEQWFDIGSVRLDPPRQQREGNLEPYQHRFVGFVIGLITGGAVGALIQWALRR